MAQEKRIPYKKRDKEEQTHTEINEPPPDENSIHIVQHRRKKRIPRRSHGDSTGTETLHYTVPGAAILQRKL